MKLKDGRFAVPAGKVAAVVTHLAMRAPPAPRPAPHDGGWRVRRVRRPSAAWYRQYFRRVGEEWLWSSRLKLEPSALQAILDDPRVEVYRLSSASADAGLLELDFRGARRCELAFFGLLPEFIGKGGGRVLMNYAIARAWQRPIDCFSVHTCTLDHPQALLFYLRSGFLPCKREIEIADDPRLTLGFPSRAAPHVPML
jgi:GNAT superfamily N-acetyltransferase